MLTKLLKKKEKNNLKKIKNTKKSILRISTVAKSCELCIVKQEKLR